MKKQALWTFIGLFWIPLAAFAWVGSEIDIPGTLQGWNLLLNSTMYTGPDGYTNWFRYSFTAGSSTNNYEFKMVTGGEPTNDRRMYRTQVSNP